MPHSPAAAVVLVNLGTPDAPDTPSVRRYLREFLSDPRVIELPRWQWWPILELEKGVSYRIHLSSIDWQHGFSLQPTNINISVHPGYEHVISLTLTQSGEFGIVCNEYCGLGHHTMTGRIYVVDRS